MAYSFKQIEAHDPSNPGLVAPNAMVTIFEPGDPAKTPLTLTTLTGDPLPNPVTVNGLGYGPAFMHATLPQVAWAGGGLTGTFESYEGMRDEAIGARTAAENAATNAAAAAGEALAGAVSEAEAAQAAAATSATAAANAADAATNKVVTTATVNGSGRLILTKADTTTIDAGVVTGAKGDKGDKGDQGLPGVNAVENDAATAGYINTAGSATRAALEAKAVPLVKDAADTQAAGTKRLQLTDTADAKGSMLDLWHWGNGTNAPNTSAYGIDLHNKPGARMALVIHQYSNNGPAIQLDNTDTSPMISIKNTNNPVQNPNSVAGTSATGAFLQFTDSPGNVMFTVLGRGEIISRPGADAAGHAIEVVGASGSNKRLFKGTMNGAGTAVEIVAAAGAAGFFPLLVAGQDYGPLFQTSADGSGRFAFHVSKNGTGIGDGIKVTNKGTGNAVIIADATATLTRINKIGALVFKASTAPVLADLVDGETVLWRDATTGDFKATSRVAGALKTATLAVA